MLSSKFEDFKMNITTRHVSLKSDQTLHSNGGGGWFYFKIINIDLVQMYSSMILNEFLDQM